MHVRDRDGVLQAGDRDDQRAALRPGVGAGVEVEPARRGARSGGGTGGNRVNRLKLQISGRIFTGSVDKTAPAAVPREPL